MVNKFYTPRGGAEQVMFDLETGLLERGHEVVPFAMRSKTDPGPAIERTFVSPRDYDRPGSIARQVRNALGIVYDWEAKRKISDCIAREKPDVAHLHNIYHQLSPSVIDALARARIPTVMTLHDFKIACPIYKLFRNGSTCKECVGKKLPLGVARHRCGRGRVSESVVLLIESTVHRLRRTYERGVCRFACPSHFMAQLMKEHGIDGSRLRVIPNAPRRVSPVSPPTARSERPHLLYAGRLSDEKGVALLIRAVLQVDKVTLTVAGDGPCGRELRQLAGDSSRISFAGRLGAGDLSIERAKAWAIAIPSLWYENAPLSLLEAYASGRPVLASNHGGLVELVRPNKTGVLVPAGDLLAWTSVLGKLESMKVELAEMGRNAHERLSADFDFSAFMAAYESLYSEAIRET